MQVGTVYIVQVRRQPERVSGCRCRLAAMVTVELPAAGRASLSAVMCQGPKRRVGWSSDIAGSCGRAPAAPRPPATATRARHDVHRHVQLPCLRLGVLQVCLLWNSPGPRPAPFLCHTWHLKPKATTSSKKISAVGPSFSVFSDKRTSIQSSYVIELAGPAAGSVKSRFWPLQKKSGFSRI